MKNPCLIQIHFGPQWRIELPGIINEKNFGINFDKCISDTVVEDHVLNDRINAVKKYDIQATPTLIINDKKFDNPQNYKKLKKTLEKLI